ncbi:Riboflavin biosynthesis protein PYRD, chloroplastic-like protein [Drosera capensis]
MHTQTPFQLHSTIPTHSHLIFTAHIPKPISSSIPSSKPLDSPKRVSNVLTIRPNHPPFPQFLMGRVVSGPRSNFWGFESGVMNRVVIRVCCQGSYREDDDDDDDDEEDKDEDDDGFYMRKAVELAREAIGCTSPNPMVGYVIVKDGKIVGEGFQPKVGQPHAEGCWGFS